MFDIKRASHTVDKSFLKYSSTRQTPKSLLSGLE